MTWDSVRAAEHFTMRNARLIDRQRFAHLFQNGPTHPVRSALAAYRNLDGGYGNGLDPDLRGHASQPLAIETALRYLDELGPIPHDIGQGVCRYLSGVSQPDGGVPPVLPTVRHTEAAPWWRHTTDFSARLDTTAHITGLLHKGRVTHPWRDTATAYCWKHIDTLAWTNGHEAVGLCTFLQHVDDRQRAIQAINRLSTKLRAVIDVRLHDHGRAHTPLDLATNPQHIARPLFTDTEIERNLDLFEKQQRPDGGWDANWEHWDATATAEREGMRTIQRLGILRAYGRVSGYLPQPRRDA
ncbi:hypothetical protein [Nocardiopsis sp. NRRL B-16309]|uniref:hypothetical protein n=1 Tax=Nocardiopsis sp. NRRL B-16309 TaxID=1519494 RepID=UPI0006AFAC39|nr:hypothetical protein [Nocardiopsis sp. NRRL B-16309]